MWNIWTVWNIRSANSAMPRVPKFTPYQQGQDWIVNIPPTMTADGKRHRHVFASESAAKMFAGIQRAEYTRGMRGSTLSHVVALDAAEALRILDPIGITLVEAARIALRTADGDKSGETFKARYLRAVREGEGKWSSRYSLDMGKILSWVPPWFMAAKCSSIDRAEMERALTDGKTLSRSTIDARCRYLSAVIGYRERHRKSSDIAILSPDEVVALIGACHTIEEKRCVALLLFAGIRPDSEHGEISRLDWSAVGKSEIYVSREVSKVSDRHVPILPRLRVMLKGHPKSGPVKPVNWQRRWKEIRKSANVTGQDICRHTFASHFLAAFGEDACKSAMGHTQGSQTLFRHYRRAVTVADGKAYFSADA